MDNAILLLFMGLIFWVIWGVLYSMLARYLKGEITVILPKRNYTFWETITGTFHLIAKKEIIWQELELHLVAYKRESTYLKDGKKQTRRVEYQRYSQSIESGVRYHPWMKKEYTIVIEIPSKEQIFWTQSKIDFGESTLGKIAKYLVINTKGTQLSWQVQVDLVSQWVDLHGKKDIFVTE